MLKSLLVLLFVSFSFSNCSYSVRYAVKQISLKIEKCPTRLLWIELVNESFKPGDLEYLKTFQINYNSVPTEYLLNSVASQSLLLAIRSKDEEIHAQIYCEDKNGVLLFDSKKAGKRYYDSKGRRQFVEGVDSIHFLDDPSQLKTFLQKLDDGD